MKIDKRLLAWNIYPYIYNEDTGKWEPYAGTDVAYSGAETAYADCKFAAATTICTITAGKKGYVTEIILYNAHAATQTFTLVDTAGTRLVIGLASQESIALTGMKIPLELAAGIVTGQAGTADSIHCTINYIEKDTTP